MNKPWEPYALHVLDAIAKIHRIRSRGDIAQDDILYDAALRNLQTLAEATQQLPDRQKNFCPDIPWRQISGFRNILVHNYLGDIDPLTIAAVIDTHLPALEDCGSADTSEGEIPPPITSRRGFVITSRKKASLAFIIRVHSSGR